MTANTVAENVAVFSLGEGARAMIGGIDIINAKVTGDLKSTTNARNVAAFSLGGFASADVGGIRVGGR